MEDYWFSDSEEIVPYPPDSGSASQIGKQKRLQMNTESSNSPSRQISVQLQLGNSAVSVEDNEMVMRPELMRVGRLYVCNYLDENLLVRKTRNGKIEIYEVLEDATKG